MKNYLTVKQVAEILQVNPETIRRWDNAGKLKARRHPMNNYRVYDAKEVAILKRKLTKINKEV